VFQFCETQNNVVSDATFESTLHFAFAIASSIAISIKIMRNMQVQKLRLVLVGWMVSAALVHLLVGLLMPWLAASPWTDAYHQLIEAGFWREGAPLAARAQQIWWMSLFGATVQSLAVCMLVLTLIGHWHRSRLAWGGLITAIILWAPQDMAISLQAGVIVNVWIDAIAVLLLVPPLGVLWWIDGKPANKSI
jgi:hypothetical protein